MTNDNTRVRTMTNDEEENYRNNGKVFFMFWGVLSSHPICRHLNILTGHKWKTIATLETFIMFFLVQIKDYLIIASNLHACVGIKTCLTINFKQQELSL